MGFALELVQADVLAQYYCSIGEEARLQTEAEGMRIKTCCRRASRASMCRN